MHSRRRSSSANGLGHERCATRMNASARIRSRSRGGCRLLVLEPHAPTVIESSQAITFVTHNAFSIGCWCMGGS
ncbi:hypothetical protein HMPREF1317_0458 [Schaalia georgiae F0490]|uniref:Uncharacterized protein n=1 Tax=Schaalia georgiae F0490 TaxID=1125717 RepID=J0NKG9_9ACTO|nr:hypothetical protein HMPREF1317_0458 [Schaalia georgiae F0490]